MHLSPAVKSKIVLALITMKAEKDNGNCAANRDNQNLYPATSQNRKRCKMCINSLKVGDIQNSLSSTKSTCQLCGNHVCQKHIFQKCKDCHDI